MMRSKEESRLLFGGVDVCAQSPRAYLIPNRSSLHPFPAHIPDQFFNHMYPLKMVLISFTWCLLLAHIALITSKSIIDKVRSTKPTIGHLLSLKWGRRIIGIHQTGLICSHFDASPHSIGGACLATAFGLVLDILSEQWSDVRGTEWIAADVLLIEHSRIASAPAGIVRYQWSKKVKGHINSA